MDENLPNRENTSLLASVQDDPSILESNSFQQGSIVDNKSHSRPFEPASADGIYTKNESKKTKKTGESGKFPKWKSFFSRFHLDFHHIITQWWIFELSACFGSVLCFALIVGILAAYNSRAQPEWPWNITINSVISWITTLMKTCLLAVVAASISQANWIHFRRQSSPLINLVIHDSASRGPLGSIHLLSNLQASDIASLGAVITILAIGIDPIVQQTLRIERRQLNSTSATLGRAQHFMATSYDEALILISGMVGSSYSGLYFNAATTGQDTPLDVTPSCATGNCTYPPFQSLAICSSCKDITPLLATICSNGTIDICQYSLPNGLELTTVPVSWGWAASSGYLPPVSRPKYGYTVLNFSVIRQSEEFGTGSNQNVTATECFLYWCVNSYRSKVENGQLEESVFESWYSDSSIVLEDVEREDIFEDTFASVPPALNASEPNANFKVSYTVSTALSHLLTAQLSLNDSVSLFDNGSVVPDVSIFPLITYEIKQLFVDRDPLSVFSMLAKSMTSHVRSVSPRDQIIDFCCEYNSSPNWTGVGLVNGTAHYLEVYIAVQWAWLGFPAALLLLTVVFLSLTIVGTARSDVAAWKGSPFPLLFHGFWGQAETKESGPAALREVYQMERLVREIHVQLKVKDKDGELKLERSNVRQPTEPS